MVAEFMVVRGGVKNWIDMPLGATDRAINIDASTNSRGAAPSIYSLTINQSSGSSFRVSDNVVGISGTAFSKQYLNYTTFYNKQTAGMGSSTLYCQYYINSLVADYTGITNTNFIGMYVDLGYTNNLPATALQIKPTIISFYYNDVNCVASGVSPRIVGSNCEFRVINGLTDYNLYANTIKIYASQNSGNRAGVFYPWLNIFPGVSLNYDITTLYIGNLSLDATAIINKSFSFTFFDSVSDIKGTITDECSGHRVEWHAGSTVTCRNLLGFYAYWDVSGATVSQQAAGFLADINANTRTFTVSGTYIKIAGTMAGTATWSGFNLDATGVVCGGTRFFYGLNVNFTGIGTGGTIAGVNLTIPTNIPAIRFSLDTGNTVIVTGDVAGVARSMIFNMPVVAGGAAAAALSWLFQLDSVTEAGLIAETDGAGTYRLPLFKVPNYSADYGGAWAAPPAPAPAGLVNGCMFIAHNTNGNLYRLYCYTNAGWHYVTLT
jgi:hypothetical protein